MPEKCPEKHDEGNIVEHEMSGKLTGKIMYMVTNILIEGSNVARELANQFRNQNDHHWVELRWFVGYLKRHKELVKLTYQKPRALRVLSNVNRNYGIDKETQRSMSGAIHTIGRIFLSWLSKMQQSCLGKAC
jgi:hypothetical protein